MDMAKAKQMAFGSCRPSHARAGGVVNFRLTPRDIPKQTDIAQEKATIWPICSLKRAPTLMKSLSPGVTPVRST